MGTKVKRHHFTARSTTRTMLSENTARMGDEGKAVGCVPPTALLFAGRMTNQVPLELKLRRCVGEQALSSLIRRERGAKSSVPDDGDQFRSLRAICLVAHQRSDWTVPERTISGAKRIAAPLA